MFFLKLLFFATLSLASSSSLDSSWSAFKIEHAKSYSTPLEEAGRKEIFTQNLNQILEHNSKQLSYRLALNKFADLTPEEFKVRNGFKKSTLRGSLQIIEFVPPENVSIPDEVDWRLKGAVTPVKDQGQCGSCWTFSSTGALEGQFFLKNGTITSLSEQNLVDCSKNDGNSGCDGGDMVPAFSYIFKNQGIDSEDSYSYEGFEGKCRFVLSGNVTTIQAATTIEMANEDHLKIAVALVGPIAVAIDASQFDFQFYSKGVYFNPNCIQGLNDVNDLDHAVLVVGYGVEDGLDYWLVKNSWGTSWGQQGYIKMSRNRQNNCGIATECSFPVI